MIKGYKIFNPDLTCRNFQYKVGETYELNSDPILCNKGFHFCKELKDVYNYYRFDYSNPVCEIEALGTVIDDLNDNKSVTNKIKIVRILDIKEILFELNLFCSGNQGSSNQGSYNQGSINQGSSNRGSNNQGSSNRGSGNRGSYNQGSDNQGSYNRGSNNQGSSNQGSYNLGSCSVGFFNTESFIGSTSNCACFNTLTGMTYFSFLRKYVSILKDVKSINKKSIISKLPNYNESLFDRIINF
jgi:PPE-repeat protein